MVPAKMLTILVSVAALFAGALLWDSDQVSAEDTVTTVSAETGTTGNCNWSLENQVLKIIGPVTADEEPNGSMADYEPKGAPWYGKTISSINLENVAHIGNYAFQDCIGVESVGLSGVKTIGDYAFSGCTSLSEVGTSADIGEYAYSGCTSLTYIAVSGSVGKYAFSGCTSLEDITILSGTDKTIGSYAFSGCVYLKQMSFKMEDSKPKLEENSLNLSDVEPLTLIVATTYDPSTYITDLVTGTKTSVAYLAGDRPPIEITGTYVYSGSEIELPTTAISFFDDSTMVVTGNKATEVGTYTVEVGLKDGYVWSDGTRTPVTAEWTILPNAGGNVGWTLNGTELTLTGSGVTADYTSASPAPWGTGITKVTIESGITGLGSYLFAGCTLLETVDFKSDMVSLGEGVFSGCTSLKSLDISGFTASIPDRMFDGCTSLESVDLPKTCTSIGVYAFNGCTALNSITFPKTVTSIGESAFAGCTVLTSLTIPSSVTSLGQSAFAGCTTLKDLTVPISLDVAVSALNPVFDKCASIEKVTFTAGDGFDYTAEKVAVTPWRISSSKEIVISNGVTSIGNFMFCNWTELSDITIPGTVTKIGESAFSGCAGLTAITIPTSVTDLGQSAFAGCTGLKELTLPIGLDAAVSTSYPVFDKCASIEKITFTGIVSHDYSSESSPFTPWRISTTLNEIVLSDELTSIGKYAFYGCTALKTITIPSSVTSIGDYAFAGCSNLTFAVFGGAPSLGTDSFKLSDSKFTFAISGGDLSSVESAAGSDATVLIADIYKPTVSVKVYTYTSSEIKSVVEDIFKGYVSSTMVPSSSTWAGTEIGGYDVSLSPMEDHAWSDGTWDPLTATWYIAQKTTGDCYWYMNGTELIIAGSGAMATYQDSGPSDWNSATKAIVKTGVTNIGAYAFKKCTKLTEVTLSDTVTSIGKYAFASTPILKIDIPGSVKTIGDSAFSCCGSLASVTIHNGLENIEGSAFYKCTSLTEIVFPASVTSIGNQAFLDAGLESADLSSCSNLKVVPSELFNRCYALNSVKLSANHTAIGGNAFAGTALTSIVIPESVNSLGAYAFENCTKLKNIDLSKTGVMVIDDQTFLGCKELESVFLPSDLTTIDSSAFSGCIALTEISIPAKVTKIDSDAFNGCEALESVLLSSDLTTIGSSAFSGCKKLIEILIPAKVRDIGSDAFSGCSSLKFICFEGEPENLWDNCFKTGTESLRISASDALFKKLSDDKSNYFDNDDIILLRASVKPTLSKSEYAYTGSEISVDIDGLDTSAMNVDSGDKGTKIGTYTLVIKLNNSEQYWSDGTKGDLKLQWKISPITGNCNWSLNGNELTISGTGAMGNYTDSLKAPWGTGITKVTFSEGVTSVGASAFADCTSLTSVTIPSSVTSIGEYAFSGCSRLISVKFECTAPTLGSSCFELSDTQECELFVYGSVTLNPAAVGSKVSVTYAILSKSLSVSKTYMYDGSEITVQPTDIVGFDSDMMELSYNTSSKPGMNILHVEPKAGYAWTDGTKAAVEVAWYSDNSTGECFWEIDGTTLKLTGSGKIGNYSASSQAPWGTGIKTVSIGEGVTYLGRYAFAGCTGLTEVVLPASILGVGDDCFNGCSSIDKITFKGKLESKNFGVNSLCLSDSDSHTFAVIGLTDNVIPSNATGSKVTVRYAVDSISRSSISVSGTYHVNGSEITVPTDNIRGFDGTYMQVSGNTGTTAGPYTLIVSLRDGYAWSDGTWDSVSTGWVIDDHTLKHKSEVPATCTETGTKEHWKCAVCNALFSDEAGKVPTTESDLIIPAKGHSYGEPGYNWTGVTACTASKTCSVCGDTVVDEAVITSTVTLEPTCTTAGVRTYTATFTKDGFTAQTQTSEIAALGHTIEYAAEVPATTSEYGVKAHWHCSVCGENFSDESGTTEVSDEELRIPKVEEGGSNTIAIAAVGVIAAVGALGAAVFFLRRR